MTANPFPDDCAVLVRFPRSKVQEQGDCSAWPWLPGIVAGQCGRMSGPSWS